MQLLVAEDSARLASSVTGGSGGNVRRSGRGDHRCSLNLLENQLVMSGRVVVVMVVMATTVMAIVMAHQRGRRRTRTVEGATTSGGGHRAVAVEKRRQ